MVIECIRKPNIISLVYYEHIRLQSTVGILVELVKLIFTKSGLIAPGKMESGKSKKYISKLCTSKNY